MDQITHDVRRENWLNIVTQCQNRQTDVSVKQWLEDNGIKEKAYYYWLRKFRREAYEQMQLPSVTSKNEVTFAEVPVPLMHSKPETVSVSCTEYIPAAVIKGNGITIELSNSISETLLTFLLREVYHA